MKSVYLATCIALLVSACGGQKGDPLPGNPDAKHYQTLEINGVVYKVDAGMGLLTHNASAHSTGSSDKGIERASIKCPGDNCLAAWRSQYSTYGLQASHSVARPFYTVKSSQEYSVTADNKIPTEGKAVYRGEAFSAAYARASEEGDSKVKVSNLVNHGIAQGKAILSVDFAEKVVSGRLRFEDASVSVTTKVPNDKNNAGSTVSNAPSANANAGAAANNSDEPKFTEETKNYLQYRTYELHEGKIVGNYYVGKGDVYVNQAEIAPSGHYNGNSLGHKLSSGYYEGKFFGPNAEEIAGQFIDNTAKGDDQSASFGGSRK